MPDEEKKIIVDSDWKAEAKREKERAAAQATQAEAFPPPSLAELINLITMQAMAGMGLLAGPGGERIPPHLETAKHFIDLLQVLEDKTKGNLTPDEQKLLDQVLYEMRMTFVQVAGGGGAAARPPR
jgi:hypothetical protein